MGQILSSISFIPYCAAWAPLTYNNSQLANGPWGTTVCYKLEQLLPFPNLHRDQSILRIGELLFSHLVHLEQKPETSPEPEFLAQVTNRCTGQVRRHPTPKTVESGHICMAGDRKRILYSFLKPNIPFSDLPPTSPNPLCTPIPLQG